MRTRTVLCVSIGVALAAFAASVTAQSAPGGTGQNAVIGAVADPLYAIEASRSAIVNRIIADQAEGIARQGIDPVALGTVLTGLRADQLLAASLVNSLADVLTIAAAPATSGSTLQRYVAISPLDFSDIASLPTADAYLVRDGNTVSIVRGGDLQFAGGSGAQVVGYFVPTTTTTVITAWSKQNVIEKDGVGTGADSWIGYTSGNNAATGSGSAVAAGTWNGAIGAYSMVVGGSNNSANGISSLVIGGFDNHAIAIDSLVGAGAGNQASGSRSVVVGGGYNLASGPWSFIGGGGRETGAGVAGSSAEDHVASGKWSTVAGGMGNRVTGQYATIGGGSSNVASADGAFIGGGGAPGAQVTINAVLYDCGTAGCNNRVTDTYGTIGGGLDNQAGNASGTNVDRAFATVGGGYANTASGFAAAVPGGTGNHAAGSRSFAAGRRAKTRNSDSTVGYSGVFMFSDNNDFDFIGLTDNEFAVRATGGVRFVTAIDGVGTPTSGVTLAAGGGAWASLSDRAAKHDLAPTDGRDVLARLAAMPVYTWRYNNEVSGALHMGPVAQDFHAAFGLGDKDTRIVTVDADGVALAAIQGLNMKLEEQAADLRAKSAELEALRAEVIAQRAVLAEIQSTKDDVTALKSALAQVISVRRGGMQVRYDMPVTP